MNLLEQLRAVLGELPYQIERWLASLACAVDPEWHPGFVCGVNHYYLGGEHFVHTSTYRCTRCDAPEPREWMSERR